MTKNQWVFAVFFMAIVVINFLSSGPIWAIATAIALALSLLVGVLLEREQEA